MNFALSDDQRMLADSIERLLSERYQLDDRRAAQAMPEGYSQDMWQAFVDLGLTMLPFPEKDGGLGLGSVEMMLVGQAFGRSLVIEPYLPSVVLAGTALASAGDGASDILGTVIAGETVAGFAAEGQVSAAGGKLNGRVAMALGTGDSGYFVIPLGEAGVCVPADCPGLSVRPYRLHGGGTAAELKLEDVEIDTAIPLAPGSIGQAIEAGLAFLAAEAAGAMQAALELTVEHLKTRQQFGRAIGSYQALQHRAAEMVVEVEQAQSAAIYAALLLDEYDPTERARGLAAVKAVIGKTGRFVAQSAVQLHGGIGVSEEHVISHYFRRLTAISMLLGDTSSHIDQLAQMGGFTSAQAQAV